MNNIITNLANHQKFNNLPFHIDVISPDAPIENHYHDCVELIFVTSGTAINYVDSFTFRHSKGNLFVISGQVSHTMFDFKDFIAYRLLFDMSIFDDWDDETITADGFVALFKMSDMGVINDSYHSIISIKGEYGERLEGIFAELLCAYEEGGTLAEKYMQLLFRAAVLLIIKKYNEKRKMNINSNANGLYRYVMDNLSEHIKISEFAERMQISRMYLYKLFVEIYGKSPTRFITDMRIRNAKALLMLTDKSITEIATSSGFENPVYFSEIFKAHEGVSPSQYRKNIKVRGKFQT